MQRSTPKASIAVSTYGLRFVPAALQIGDLPLP